LVFSIHGLSVMGVVRFLDDYITNRNRMLQEMMMDTGVSDRNQAKKLIIKVLNGGNVSNINVPWWGAMCTEFARIASQIATHADHAKTLDICRDKGSFNLNARTMSTVLNNVENLCLESLYTFLQDNKCVPDGRCVLIFDGMMVPDTPAIRGKIITGDGFLARASEYIQCNTGYVVEIKVKEFDEVFELPEDYADKVSDILMLNGRDDKVAAVEFVKRYKDRLIKCNGRVFWDGGRGVFTDNLKEVKEGILDTIGKMKIFMRGKNSLIPYSGNSTCAEGCIKYILADRSLEQPDFVDNLFRCSLHYLAFEDGIYSFGTGELLLYPVPGVYFMHKINRKFPTCVDPAVKQEVMEKLIIPAFPNEEQQKYYLHRLGRAMAGDVEDKKWHVCIGERNSSKGVLCDLISNSFGGFVQTINSENLLIKSSGASGDAAKAQSWMSSLEFKRLAISNEIQLQGDRSRYVHVNPWRFHFYIFTIFIFTGSCCRKAQCSLIHCTLQHRVDGNLIKRIASGGDAIELRTNYKDEVRKRLQTTFMLSCNDFPPIDPVDACSTLEVFEFHCVFQPAHVIAARGDNCPRHWRVADPKIKTEWIQCPNVIDAFTMMVLEAWKPDLLKPPECVIEHTKHFNGSAGVSEYDRFAEIVKYDPRDTPDTRFFTEEIKLALNDAGLKGISSQKINMFVRKLHGHETFPPHYFQFPKGGVRGKREYGFNHLKLKAVVAYSVSEERRVANLAMAERVRQQVRNGDNELGKRTFDDMMGE
jgi:hypothetical protein